MGVKMVWVSCGDRRTATLPVTGHIYVFGHGEHGQLGHGISNYESRPVLVSDLAQKQMNQVQYLYSSY
jgi:alpha-tubulin suppressor-like RCC1 family protein